MGRWGKRPLWEDQKEITKEEAGDPQNQEWDAGRRGSVGRPGGKGFRENGDGDP